MRFVDIRLRLDLERNAVLYYKVNTQRARNHEPEELDVDPNFVFEGNTISLKKPRYATMVGRFAATGSDPAIHLIEMVYGLLGILLPKLQFIEWHAERLASGA